MIKPKQLTERYVLKKWNLLNFHILAYTCYLFAQ